MEVLPSQMIPVRYLPDPARIQVQDVGHCRFDQPTFGLSLETWEEDGETREYSLGALPSPSSDLLKPALFIFHMARCGSTLLARALAQSPRNFVISEAQVLNDLLWHLCEGNLSRPIRDEQSAATFHKVIQAMIVQRDTSAEFAVIKFSSWNVRLISLIQQSFPEVPLLFLYRQPEEVMVSCLHQSPGFLTDLGSEFSQTLTGISRERILEMEQCEYLALCLKRMIESALAANSWLLNYEELTAGNFASILNHFQLSHTAEELSVMTDFFAIDSKRDRPFQDDRREKQAAVTPEIRQAAERYLRTAHQRLLLSPRNLPIPSS